MAKKYLSLDEAAEKIGATTERLLRLREDGEIRGFADRGSWKFREQDVEEFVRSQQTDSAPDMPILPKDSADDGNSDDSVLAEDDDGKLDLNASDSDVRLFFDESLFDDDEDEVDLTESDSDVQLAGDSGPKLESDDSGNAGSVLDFDDDDAQHQSDSDSDVSLVSDGDVNLVGSGSGTEAEIEWAPDDTVPSRDTSGKLPGSETDAEISLPPGLGNDEESDSDVQLTETDSAAALGKVSDSDVLLTDSDSDTVLPDVSDSDSDSDVLLTDSDSDVRLSGDSADDVLGDLDSDSDVHLVETDSNVLADDSDSDVKLGVDRTDSDIRLVEASDESAGTEPEMAVPEDSDLKLIDSDSENEDDSGISLEIDDSGISLEADDSGISLESLDSGTGFTDDSGITLDAGESGISLEAPDSGIALFEDDDDDSGLTLDGADTSSTMPMQAVPGAAAALAESGGQTTHMNVPESDRADSDFELAGLDQDDDDDGTDTSVLMFEDDAAPADSKQTLEAAGVMDDEYGSEEAFGDEDYEDEFDEEMDDVWDAEDEVDEGFDAGESEVDGFAAPAAVRSSADVPWGTGWTATVAVSALLSVFSAFVGVELVRTMWLWTQPGASESWLLGILGSLFG